jgi:cytochrome c oxidase subunit II
LKTGRTGSAPPGITLARGQVGSIRTMFTTLSVLMSAALVAAAMIDVPGSRIASAPQVAAPRVIEVVARRYAFEPADVEVTEGETVRLMVRSGDGLHGIEIKALKVKHELPRGADPVAIEFTAPAPGRYPILCSEFCGDGHEEMKGTLIVTARPAAARGQEMP